MGIVPGSDWKTDGGLFYCLSYSEQIILRNGGWLSNHVLNMRTGFEAATKIKPIFSYLKPLTLGLDFQRKSWSLSHLFGSSVTFLFILQHRR